MDSPLPMRSYHRKRSSRMLKKSKIADNCHARESKNPWFSWILHARFRGHNSNKEFFSNLLGAARRLIGTMYVKIFS
jgi:hypothetical protein